MMQAIETILNVLSQDTVALWGVNVFVQVSLVAGLTLLLERLIRDSAPLRWWVLGSALALILVSPITLLMSQRIGLGAFALSPSSTVESEPTLAHVQLPQPTQAIAATPLPALPIENESTEQNFVADASEGLPAIVDSRKTNAWGAGSCVSLIKLMMLVWAAGAMFRLGRMFHGWRKLQRIRRTATSVKDPAIVGAFVLACEKLSMRTLPALIQTDEFSAPVATGGLRPAVLLPRQLPESLTAEQLSDVLIHEAAHIARHDQVIVIAQNIATSLFWFHPLVKLVNDRFARAREEVCDNYVLRCSNAASYSRTLLCFAQQVAGTTPLPASVGMLDGWSLESRVAGLLRINRNTTTRLMRRHVLVVVAVFSLLFSLAGLATITLADDKPVPPQPVVEEDQSAAPSKDSAVDKKMEPNMQPATPANEKVEAALPGSTVFRFAGRVLDPNDQPYSGAKVYLARQNAKPVAVSGADGTFEFTCAKSQLPNNAAWGVIKLVAVAKGHGLAISPILRFEMTGQGMKDLKARNPNKQFNFGERKRVLKLVKDDMPIQGRIVSLEGQPVEGVNVRLRFVNQAYARFAFSPVVTDANGKFQIHGIGQGRTVRLVAKSETTEFTVFFARTMDVPAKKRMGMPDPFTAEQPMTPVVQGVTYGAKFTHVVSGSVPVEGRITDSVSGDPVPGVMVSVMQLSNRSEAPAREEMGVVTDANGRYRLIGVPLGSNQLRVIAESESQYLARRAIFHVKDSLNVINGDLKITKGVRLTGQAKDSKTGKPVTGLVQFQAHPDNKNFRPWTMAATTRTDAQGRYSMNVVPGKGYLSFEARSKNYTVGVVSDEVQAELDPTVAIIPARPNGLIAVNYHSIQMVTTAKDALSANADISLIREPKVTLKLADQDGKSVVGASVDETLLVTMGGFAIGVREQKLPSNTYQVQKLSPQATTQVIALHRKRRLIGRIELTDSDTPNLPLIIMKDGKREEIHPDEPVRTRIDGDAELALTMRPAGTITGRIVDEDGDPRIVRLQAYNQRVVTDEQGWFEIPLLLPGYPVSVVATDRERQQLLGTVASNVMLKVGEKRDLGDVKIKPGRPN